MAAARRTERYCAEAVTLVLASGGLLLSLRAHRYRPRRRSPDQPEDLPPPHEHLPRKRILLSTPVKHERVPYAIPWARPHVSFRFLPLPAFSCWQVHRAADREGRSDPFT